MDSLVKHIKHPAVWVGLALSIVVVSALVKLPDSTPTLASNVTPPGPNSVEAASPSATNVRPDIQQRMMRLGARLRENPDDVATLAQLAMLAGNAHQVSLADSLYGRYTLLRPDERQPYLDHASLLARDGQYDAARRVMNQMLSRHPGDAEALYNLGAIEANLGNVSAARNFWEQVIQSNSDATLTDLARSNLARLAQGS
jgi:cytochrome c-type biogenesis protein CcmH/NrfG